MTEAEEAFAAAFVAALTRDLTEHPVPGKVARVVVRWSSNDEPLYLTIHALGTGEEDELGEGDAWYPLEWTNVTHFEGGGARHVLERVDPPPAVIAALRKRDELPVE